MRTLLTLFSALLLVLGMACTETPRRGDGGTLADGEMLDANEPGRDSVRADSAAHDSVPHINPDVDSDGDHLPDDFERLFSGFDPAKADSDGDGTADGAEDKDGDGLTAEEEWAAWQLDPIQEQPPSPWHKDLLLELDYQSNLGPSSTALREVIEAFAAAAVPNPDGASGVALHVYIDERDLTVEDMSGDLDQRLSYLAAHGPTFASSPAHVAKMVHVIFVGKRADGADRGGDTVASTSAPVEKAGILIYVGYLASQFPKCLDAQSSAITLEEVVISSLVHELGHALQLGHDTEVGGAVNPYNIMATDLGSCSALKKRTRGLGNSDASLGATEAAGGPRFSQAAAELIKLTNKISVEANQFESGNGYEM